MMLEMKRDASKRAKPFTAADFYCWKPQSQDAKAPPAAGAAMLELINRGAFPSFALGEWYDDLAAAGADEPLPFPLAWWSEEIILLAPVKGSGGWSGYLIAMAEAAGTEQECINEAGEHVRLAVPPSVGTVGAVEAETDVLLPIV